MKKYLIAAAMAAVVLAGCQSTKNAEPAPQAPAVEEKAPEIAFQSDHMTYINAHMDEGFLTGKTDYTVQGMMVTKPTHLYNKLELVSYDVTDDNVSVILKGTLGEEWVTKVSKVMKTYTKPDGTPLTEADFTSHKDSFQDLKTKPTKGANFALFVPKDVILQVQTAWGDVLYTNASKVDHGKGDFLVCSNKDGQPDLSDVWVVNGAQFPTTYDMTNAPADLK